MISCKHSKDLKTLGIKIYILGICDWKKLVESRSKLSRSLRRSLLRWKRSPSYTFLSVEKMVSVECGITINISIWKTGELQPLCESH